mgnify:CR=1 FL=1
MKKLISIAIIAILTYACETTKTTPDNTIILDQNYDISQVETKLQNATEKKSSKEFHFENGTTVEVQPTVLISDAENSVIKNLQIKLIKGCANCEFTASASSNQSFRKTYDNVRTSVKASVMSHKKKIGSQSIVKYFTISSDGSINEM